MGWALCSKQNPTSERAGYCVPGRTPRAQGVVLTTQNAWSTGSPLSKANARPKNLQIIVQTVQTGYKPGYKPALKPVQTVQTGNFRESNLDISLKLPVCTVCTSFEAGL